MEAIEQHLRRSIGLAPDSIGSATLGRIIRLRMKAAGVETAPEYERLLHRSAAEWSQLVEAVVITETWFFRDHQAFGALAAMLLLEWLPANPDRPAAILSLPCASGEEPFTIAMALLDAGVPASRFGIHGVDLSRRALGKAVEGVYGKNSFRGRNLGFRNCHFTKVGNSYAIKQGIRDCVSFQQANLLDDTSPLGSGCYDFIFCRNLLIYFDAITQRRAFEKLGALLTQDGALFTGPAEVPIALENGFAPLKLPMAFACRRAGPRPNHADHRQPATPIAPARIPAQPAPSPLHTARELADEGNFDEAVRLCYAHLSQHGASVQAYHLLAVIHDARGHPDAREFYRKALYLDPNHYESLVQLALLAEKKGDLGAAINLRRRALRAQSSPP
jgi:chemotaxis protein methyltransferase WspC